MPNYAILANPGHNRIYLDAALPIAQQELQAMCAAVGSPILGFEPPLAGLPASLCFRTETPLSEPALAAMAAASIYYALFEVLDGGLLKPVVVPDIYTFPPGMSQILKYVGKTNEQFTRLMINLGLAACGTGSERIRLVDPMCGKGTTLYEGMVRGFDVEGIEINGKWVQEIQAYMVRYLKMGKYKHKVTKSRRNGPDGKKVADSFVLDTAANKADYAAGNTQSFKLYSGDTRQANLLLKRNSCDLLVSDLPYGVQHGNKNAKDSKLERSALGLLEQALPAWHHGLKPKGALVISFNEFTMKWQEVAPLLDQAGFEVGAEAPFTGYLHRVDQSINRNLIVATKR
ncbi:TRM11 family SAM-dependent methyltransferase [Ferrimonas marina]|uniref:Putative RNA methylase family UPF0020 n=1 Tax=Ferrimonas marina TaxID=299255 RepID=A0A1M5ZPX8_9GAMM|nr:DNA methylase [Ferrimonas marina]SHI26254.1 Putative RNA methylase family UPF0020 [Ferrimonas marina]